MLKRIDTYNLLISLALFFILCNVALFLDPIPVLRWSFSFLRLFAVIYAFSIAIPKLRFGKYTVVVLFFYIVAGLITIMHNGSAHTWLSYTINSVGVVLLIYLSMLSSPRNTIRTLVTIFDFYIYSNFILTLIYPKGLLDGAYLLGVNYNSIGPVLICGLAIHYFAYKMHLRNWLTLLLLGGISIASTTIVGSMTSVIGCLLLLVYIFIPTHRLRKIALMSLFVFYLIFQTFIVFYQGDISTSETATYFIEDVLQKNLNFTNRVYIWEKSQILTKESPITGYGMQDSEWFESIFWVKSAHNIIYQILIYGGSVLLTFLFFSLLMSIIRAYRHPSILSHFMLYTLCVFYFMMMMEAYNLVLIFLLQELTYYSPEFSKVIDEQ